MIKLSENDRLLRLYVGLQWNKSRAAKGACIHCALLENMPEIHSWAARRNKTSNRIDLSAYVWHLFLVDGPLL